MSGVRSEGGRTGLGEVLGSLVADLQNLVRGEIKLARAEMDQKIDTLLVSAIWLLGGALVAFAGLVVLLQAIAAGLALVMPAWAAFLIVGIVIVVAGALVAYSGLSSLSLKTLTPNRTVSSLEKDIRIVKEHT